MNARITLGSKHYSDSSLVMNSGALDLPAWKGWCKCLHVPSRLPSFSASDVQPTSRAPTLTSASTPHHQTTTAAMTSEDATKRLGEEFPCRESQIQQLTALYSVCLCAFCYPKLHVNFDQPQLPLPPLVVAHGLTATGKTSIIQEYLKSSGIPFALVKSRECITGRHLLERTVMSCLDALDERYAEDEGAIDRRLYARTENLSSLTVNMSRLLEGRGRFVLVLDGIDKQREAPPTLGAALARLGESV